MGNQGQIWADILTVKSPKLLGVQRAPECNVPADGRLLADCFDVISTEISLDSTVIAMALEKKAGKRQDIKKVREVVHQSGWKS